MPQVIIDILKGYLRYALAGWGGWMVVHGIVSSNQYEELIGYLTAGTVTMVTVLAWSAWAKIKATKAFNTALGEAGLTAEEVADSLRRGGGASPLAPKTAIPMLKLPPFTYR